MPRRTRSSAGSAGTSPKRLRTSTGAEENRAGRDAALGGGDQNGRRNKVTDSEVNNKNRALKPIDSTEGTVLEAKELDFHMKDNREAHHTDEFEQEDLLIVRRGQMFSISVTFSREYNREADDIRLQLTTGTRPQESKDTLLRLPVTHDEPSTRNDWFAVFRSSEKNTVKLDVYPVADAIVGRYNVFVETVTQGDEGQVFTHRMEFVDNSFVLLFNAWCQDDSVYMEGDRERQEYVLADYGRIWVGSRFRNSGRPWNFGQFEECVLDAALYVLDKAELSCGARSCPIKITRCVSSRANSCDNDGILTGRWTSEYPKDCTVPWAWTGSVAILEEFMKTKQSVSFGQCWVFSGLVTTLLRCLGIPTRSVTNFESAHDCDASITIDYHWNEDNEPESDLDDSVWNFHVWNESYFKRSDLPEGYGGWQALDATPQEASEGVMRCGPAPVKAIREGNVYLPYDAPFIFAEVNGDKVHWLLKKDGSMEVINKEKFAVGHQISTKALGSNALNDITEEYKFREGTPEERSAVRKAFRYSSRREHRVYDVPDPDVKFTLTTPDSATIGEPFSIGLSAQNQSSEARQVSLRLTAVSSYYTGVSGERIGTKVFTVDLPAGETKSVDLEITPEAYQGYLKPESMVKVYMKGIVYETKRSYAQISSFEVTKPSLKVEVPERVEIGENFDVVIKFNNPLSDKLTGGVFRVEAARITKPLAIPYRKAIGPKQEVTYTVENLRATRAGYREVEVNFTCDQISGLTGSAQVYVSYSAR